jgi:uncharacterized protein DUF4389
VAYPVTVTIEPQYDNRNRLTTAFRLILAIPHLLLVGGIGVGVAFSGGSGGGSGTSLTGESGLLGAVAWILAVISWFTIVALGEHMPPIRRFTRFYLRWRVRALAYLMLLEDRYPPFDDTAYPASVSIVDPAGARDRLTVGLRILLAIPHFIALAFVMLAWWVTAVVSWVLILLTARYPRGLYDFGVGALRWLIRVEAYMLLLVDDYPPFSLT